MKSMALGRGLDALFGEIDESYENEGTQKDSILEVSLKDIRPNPFQPQIGRASCRERVFRAV